MKKISQLVGNDLYSSEKHFDLIGLELEFEKAEAVLFSNFITSEFWNITSDGSLKNNGVEFLLKKPFCFEKVKIALEKLKENIKGYNLETNDRTGVHIHLNVLDLTIDELKDFLKLYIIFEKFLYTIGDYNRIYNNNCVPISEYQGFLDFVLSLSENIKTNTFYSLIDNCYKYSGCNVYSIIHSMEGEWNEEKECYDCMGRGSLEFRMFKGTDSIKLILFWIKVLLKMKEYIKGKKLNKSPKDFSTKGHINFFIDVFGEDILKELVSLKIVEPFLLEQKLIEGVRNYQVIYEKEKFSSIEEDFINVFDKPKKY